MKQRRMPEEAADQRRRGTRGVGPPGRPPAPAAAVTRREGQRDGAGATVILPADLDQYVDAHLDAFLELSEVMTARPNLPRETAREFFGMLLDATQPWYGNPSYDARLDPQDEAPPRPRTLDVLFELFSALKQEDNDQTLEQRVVRTIYPDIELSTVVKNLLIVWYNGALGSRQCSSAAYPHTLVWEAISAHPAGIPGPYFGSWAYPPPQPIEHPSALPEKP